MRWNLKKCNMLRVDQTKYGHNASLCWLCKCCTYYRSTGLIHQPSHSFLGLIQQLRGPNFTQFWPPSPLSPRVDCGHFTWYLPYLTWPSVEFLLTPSPPLLVHVVIEWPLVACGEHSKLFCILFTSVFANMWLKALTYFSTAHAQNPWPWNDLF